MHVLYSHDGISSGVFLRVDAFFLRLPPGGYFSDAALVDLCVAIQLSGFQGESKRCG